MGSSERIDAIEKKILLRAPRSRVWRALTDAGQFGAWFGVRVRGSFRAGTVVQAMLVPTEVDPDVAEQQRPYTGITFPLFIERVEPESVFSFRWHPGVDPVADANAPTTLVQFTLADAEEGTLLTVRETGFDAIPLEHRAKAFTDNAQGWAIQLTLIEKYLASGS